MMDEGLKVVKEYLDGCHSFEEIKEISNLCNKRWREIQHEGLKGFNIGDRVRFTNKGEKWEGEIEKINTKSLSVLTDVPRKVHWTVAPSSAVKI